MTDAERLRNAIKAKRYAHEVDHLNPQEVCRAIVDEFGLTRAGVETASGWGWQERNTKIVRAILDVAEGRPKDEPWVPPWDEESK